MLKELFNFSFCFLYIAISFSKHAFFLFEGENLLLRASCSTFREEGICEVAYFSIVACWA